MLDLEALPHILVNIIKNTSNPIKDYQQITVPRRQRSINHYSDQVNTTKNYYEVLGNEYKQDSTNCNMRFSDEGNSHSSTKVALKSYKHRKNKTIKSKEVNKKVK